MAVPTGVGEGADQARYVLGRMLRQLDGSRELVIALAEGRTPDVVLRALDGTLTSDDQAAPTRLRAGLDRISGSRRHA